MRRRQHYVEADVQLTERPPPERQHIDSKKWKWSITVSFNRTLPAIPSERFGALNELLRLTEVDRLLVGVNFVTVRTDEPAKYAAYELALAVCNCFGWKLSRMRELKPVQVART